VDGGVTHKFIDASLVARRGLQTEEFEGLNIAVADGYNMTCRDRIPNLELKSGNYSMTDVFYVVELSNIDIVLGVHWLYSLGMITMNYHNLEMGFRDVEGKKVVLRGMSNGKLRIVSTKRMERIFRNGDVAYATKCLITTQRALNGRKRYHT
jgi:hypothetical protein